MVKKRSHSYNTQEQGKSKKKHSLMPSTLFGTLELAYSGGKKLLFFYANKIGHPREIQCDMLILLISLLCAEAILYNT
jgi:hypothetical protein